jgi:hypothetical protein
VKRKEILLLKLKHKEKNVINLFNRKLGFSITGSGTPKYGEKKMCFNNVISRLSGCVRIERIPSLETGFNTVEFELALIVSTFFFCIINEPVRF